MKKPVGCWCMAATIVGSCWQCYHDHSDWTDRRPSKRSCWWEQGLVVSGKQRGLGTEQHLTVLVRRDDSGFS